VVEHRAIEFERSIAVPNELHGPHLRREVDRRTGGDLPIPAARAGARLDAVDVSMADQPGDRRRMAMNDFVHARGQAPVGGVAEIVD